MAGETAGTRATGPGGQLVLGPQVRGTIFGGNRWHYDTGTRRFELFGPGVIYGTVGSRVNSDQNV